MAKLKYGIIGHPVRHSLSPAMQGAAFHALGIDAEYLLYDVEPEKLNDFLKDAPAGNISGFNVTVPHKIKAKEYIERAGSLDENARRLGAVNTVKVAGDGSICGYNTDGPGFYRSLVEDLGFEPEGKTAFFLGAGGAAHACVMYLGNGPKKIYVFDVDGTKARDLKAHYGKYYDAARLAVVGQDEYNAALKDSALVVNTTPVGMKDADPSPVDTALLRRGQYVYDLVYNRPSTQLVKEATRLKLHASTGLGMLLYQGAIAFEIWTGAKAPVGVMRKALREALKESARAAGSK